MVSGEPYFGFRRYYLRTAAELPYPDFGPVTVFALQGDGGFADIRFRIGRYGNHEQRAASAGFPAYRHHRQFPHRSHSRCFGQYSILLPHENPQLCPRPQESGETDC